MLATDIDGNARGPMLELQVDSVGRSILLRETWRQLVVVSSLNLLSKLRCIIRAILVQLLFIYSYIFSFYSVSDRPNERRDH